MKCSICGGPLKRNGQGRPRKRCEKCSPPRGKAAALVALKPRPTDSVREATLAQLTEAGREDTTLGKTALALATRIDSNLDPGSALAALAKQLESTLESATKGANAVASPMDELRARRAAKHA